MTPSRDSSCLQDKKGSTAGTLKDSYIPLVVRDFLTSNIKLRYTGPESVLKCLGNGRQWAKAINNCKEII